MKISEKLKNNTKTTVSLEIFPPKKDEAFRNVGTMLGELQKLDPEFISVTCGAGGSANRNRTIELAARIKNEFGTDSMAHMTSITLTKDSVERELAAAKEAGVENILALRGDIPRDDSFDRSKLSEIPYKYAYQLIEKIKSDSDFCIAAGAYPEGHIEEETLDISASRLKLKQDAGAEFFVSQLFFTNDLFYKFLEVTEKHGITVPILPGIMPMMSKSQISNMIFMCGASLPSAMIKLLNKYENSPEDLKKAGIEYAGAQILDLAAHGIKHIHLYSMNKPEIARSLMNVVISK